MARWTGLLASDALRGGPEHTGAFGAMVLAQALGDGDRQVSRHEKSDCRAGATAGRNHAPHLWTGRALQGNSNGMAHVGARAPGHHCCPHFICWVMLAPAVSPWTTFHAPPTTAPSAAAPRR